MSAMSDLHLAIQIDLEDDSNTMTIDQIAKKHNVDRDVVQMILVDMINELLDEMKQQ